MFFDATSALDLSRGRPGYSPTLGRWITVDPSGLGPDVNDYRFVGNGPTNTTDPSGLQPPQASNPPMPMPQPPGMVAPANPKPPLPIAPAPHAGIPMMPTPQPPGEVVPHNLAPLPHTIYTIHSATFHKGKGVATLHLYKYEILPNGERLIGVASFYSEDGKTWIPMTKDAPDGVPPPGIAPGGAFVPGPATPNYVPPQPEWVNPSPPLGVTIPYPGRGAPPRGASGSPAGPVPTFPAPPPKK
jgi:RHS repeat-associated protein